MNWNKMSEDQLRIVVGDDMKADKILKSLRNNKVWYQRLVIDGNNYYTEKPGIQTHDWFKGFAGRVFEIPNLYTGEVVITNDLWHQGETDEEPNAVFLPDMPELNFLYPQPSGRVRIFPMIQTDIAEAKGEYADYRATLPVYITYWGKLWREIRLQTLELYLAMLEVRANRAVAITDQWERMRPDVE